MTQNPFQWEHPKAMAYHDTIRRRIIGYDFIFQGMVDLLTEQQWQHALIVGAGGGQELVSLGQAFPGRQFTAVDPSEQMLTLASLTVEQEGVKLDVDYQPITVEELPDDIAFSLATCHLVLHFLKEKDKKSLIQAIAGRMPAGGTIFFSSINGQLGSPQLEQILDAWGNTMQRNGITEKQWLAFRQSFGDTCFPLPTEEILSLFIEAGFGEAIMYYKAFSVEAFMMKKVK